MSAMSAGSGRNLPNGWRWATMGDIAEVIGGGTPRTTEPANFEAGEIPWITPADLSGYTEKYISHGGRFITHRGLESSAARLLPAGTVLFSSRAPIGYVAIARNAIATNQGFKSFILKDGVLPEYVYWWLKGSKATAESLASGTTFLEISGANAKKIPIPIAPLDQQRKIVAELEKQFSRLDEALASLVRLKARTLRYRTTILAAACNGSLVGFDSRKWPRRTLGEIATTIRNGFPGKPDADEGIRIFRISAVRPMKLNSDDVRYLSGPISQYKESRVEPGDVLFTRYNGSRELVGVCAVVPAGFPETIHPDKLIRVRVPNEILSSDMLAVLASAGQGRAFLESRIRTTAGQSGISGSDLRSLPLTIPPGDVQELIHRELERRFSVVNRVNFEIEASVLKALRLRQSVLARAYAQSH